MNLIQLTPPTDGLAELCLLSAYFYWVLSPGNSEAVSNGELPPSDRALISSEIVSKLINKSHIQAYGSPSHITNPQVKSHIAVGLTYPCLKFCTC